MNVSHISLTDNSEEVKAMAREQAMKCLEMIGLLAEGYAKVNITEQDAVDTGRLRNSITHKVVESDYTVYVGTNVEYGVYVECGTGKYYPEGGRQTPWMYVDADGWYHWTAGMRARPYLRPAIEENIETYKQVLQDALRGE